MRKPFDIGAVDMLLVNAIHSFREPDPVCQIEAGSGDCAAGAAADILVDKERSWKAGGASGYGFVQAGFTFAMRLCLHVLADPLHIPSEDELEDALTNARRYVDMEYEAMDRGKSREPQPVA